MTTDSEMDDAQLVGAVRDGDGDAYQELVARYQGHVYGMAYSMVGDWSEAQDIAQETFIRVYANLDQLREPARFAPWLRRVAFSVTMNWLRAYRPDLYRQLDGRVDLDRLDIPDFRPGPVVVVEKRELARAVMRAVASLPPRYRVPLTMFHLDGLSYQKVADFLDIPLGTAKSLIHRAREKLKPELGAYLEEELTPMVKEVFDAHRLPKSFSNNVIAGLEKAYWGGGKNSVMGALAAALESIDEGIPYEFLMGVSGGAFRLQVAQPGWCPSAPHANCGFRLYPVLEQALPYQRLQVHPEQDGGEGRVAPLTVLESIDQGMPAFYSREEEALVVGYDNHGRDVLLRPYSPKAEGYETKTVDELLSDWGGFGVVRKTDASPDRRRSLIRSLEIAVQLAETPTLDKYAVGFAAYEAWIRDLRDGSERDFPQRLGNGHVFYSLIDARRCAAKYLASIAPELGGDARSHLEQASELYAELVAILTRRDPTELAPMPWTPAGKRWNQELRNAQADVLEQAFEVERRAVREIEAALAALRPA